MSNSAKTEKAKVKKWVGHKLDVEIERRLERLANANDVTQIAVMPDVHLAGEVCNGVAVATTKRIYPQCIGGDIGCGYLSVPLIKGNAKFFGEIDESTAGKILAGLYRAVPFNKHAKPQTSNFERRLSTPSLEKLATREGQFQMGTLGRGNHFVEFQRDQCQQLWLLIHSGSRAMGQMISAHHLSNAKIDPATRLKFLDSETVAGIRLLNDLQWASEYATANRLAMLKAIDREVLSHHEIVIDTDSMIHLDHNHVQLETHDKKQVWVHRKGAQGVAPNQVTVIPGSMGTATYVVAGRGNQAALDSCSHGAGRSMSRSEAANRLSTKSLCREMEEVWFDQRNLQKLVDESPSAYKNIRKVMKAQKELVRIIDQRQPVLSFKSR